MDWVLILILNTALVVPMDNKTACIKAAQEFPVTIASVSRYNPRCLNNKTGEVYIIK